LTQNCTSIHPKSLTETTKLSKLYSQTDQIPDDWRNAAITPIFKKGDRREPQTYSGISILNTDTKFTVKFST
jgi:hypothetical protein